MKQKRIFDRRSSYESEDAKVKECRQGTTTLESKNVCSVKYYGGKTPMDLSNYCLIPTI